MAILCAELTGVELSDKQKAELTEDCLPELFKLADRHDLAHILAGYITAHETINNAQLLEKIKQNEIKSAFHNEQMKYTLDLICETLEQQGIAYIPLKGSVLKPFYPKDGMRTSCDIDVLIKENDIDASVKALQNQGFTVLKCNFHDVSLLSESKILLELHFNVKENHENLDLVLKDAWEYAELEAGHRYKFSDEFFVFHILSHMAHHFMGGGCGLRSLMDLWVMKHKMGLDYLIAENLLKKAGIFKFAEQVSRLSEVCFDNTSHDKYTKSMLAFIVNGGVFGNVENRAKYDKTGGEGSVKFVLRRVFPPIEVLKKRHAILEKAPILLPFFWLRRIIRNIFKGNTERYIEEAKSYSSADFGEVNDIESLRNFLEL